VFLELRILKDLWAHFAQLRIPKELAEKGMRAFGSEAMNPALCSGLGSS
jgi:hypothetical protein